VEARTKKWLEFSLKVLAVIAPALITSYFSYRTAKVESEAKANAGYEALVSAVKDLQAAAEKSTTGVAKLEGRLETVERLALQRISAPITAPASGTIGMGSLGTLGHGSGSGSGSGYVGPLKAPKPAKSEMVFEAKELPPDLDSAYREQKAKK
jgi:hypothetical protein